MAKADFSNWGLFIVDAHCYLESSGIFPAVSVNKGVVIISDGPPV